MRDSWKPADKAAEAAIDNPGEFMNSTSGQETVAPPEESVGNGREDSDARSSSMKYLPHAKESGKLGWILLWLIGVPIPVLLVLFLLRGCT